MITDPDSVTGTFARGYAIEREIGRGASAVVYLARDTHNDRLVAVKVLREALQDSRAPALFLREIEHHQGLVHPGIVPVLDWGTRMVGHISRFRAWTGVGRCVKPAAACWRKPAA